MLLVHEVGFNVGLSVDNAAANRKFYKDYLCKGVWKESVTNPLTGGKIFLIFDPTHVVKNIYNNFLTKRLLELPSLPPLVADSKKALLSDCCVTDRKIRARRNSKALLAKHLMFPPNLKYLEFILESF